MCEKKFTDDQGWSNSKMSFFSLHGIYLNFRLKRMATASVSFIHISPGVLRCVDKIEAGDVKPHVELELEANLRCFKITVTTTLKCGGVLLSSTRNTS